MKRFGGRRVIFRVLFVWIVTAFALDLSAKVIPGVHVSGWDGALVAAAVLGLLNALVWPLLIRFALPITVMTIGLAVLVFNGAVVYATSHIVGHDDFKLDNIPAGIAITLVITLVNSLATTALAIDDDDFYYRSVVRRHARRRGATKSDIPGVVFFQIDGLAHQVLLHAVRNGEVATMARWLRDGSHQLLRWETDWSSQTGASQAGLLHGSNADMPGFRWWEKERGAAMVTNHPRDAMAIEERHSNGRGLLAFDGASRANVFSGDAARSSLTMSTVLKRDRPGSLGEAYYAYFANPYNVARTFLLSIVEIVTELWNAADDRRRDIVPRVDRDMVYALVRAWTCVVQRDLQVETVIGDIYEGRPVVYSDLLAYDEVAHHSGVERHDTLRVLRRVDRALARVEVAARGAPRPYQFAILSDHGQTQGPTFLQRYGRSLEDLVREACHTTDVQATAQGDESWGYLAGSLTEASAAAGLPAQAVRTMTRSRTADGVVALGPEAKAERRRRGRKGNAKTTPEVVVMASGNLGLIYFARRPGRLTLEEIEEAFPQVIPALRDHPGIAFMLVRSRERGAMAIGRSGTNYLDEGRVEGDDPLAPFGPRAASHVKRTDGFAHVGDIMVNSAYDPATDEVFAFEELVGSHGGMGGQQSYPFLMVPQGWQTPEKMIVGAETVHQWMRRWLADLGHDSFRAEGDGSSATL